MAPKTGNARRRFPEKSTWPASRTTKIPLQGYTSKGGQNRKRKMKIFCNKSRSSCAGVVARCNTTAYKAGHHSDGVKKSTWARAAARGAVCPGLRPRRRRSWRPARNVAKASCLRVVRPARPLKCPCRGRDGRDRRGQDALDTNNAGRSSCRRQIPFARGCPAGRFVAAETSPGGTQERSPQRKLWVSLKTGAFSRCT